MKKFLLIIFVFTLFIACTSDKTTTYYLIRHAEKDRTNTTNKNPNLNSDGVIRAEKWAKNFENIKLDAVYSTDYNRTQQTAAPTAKSKGLIVQSYNPSKMYDSIFKKNTKGKTILVVGHSNTTPVFANAILGQKKYKNMADNDNASLYIVTVVNDKKSSEIKKVN
jgi:broad specificity phosphatase PhoE|tara:strand:+ start:3041 stop:3535 length:495 start_codon:yes stop_codon:yes gene_type:complete